MSAVEVAMPWTRAVLERRFARARDRRFRGDHDLSPHLRPTGPLRPAAVLVPVIDHGDHLTVLFTRRTEHLRAHAGQISFPGGRAEPGDASAEATALRETREEIGLSPAHVHVLGRLDTYVTRTGFRVIPFVGLLSPPLTLRPDPGEVAEMFEVPLDHLLDPAHHRQIARDDGARFHTISYGRYHIWGATAGMVVNLTEHLKGS